MTLIKNFTYRLALLGLFGCLIALLSCSEETEDLARICDSEMSQEKRFNSSSHDWKDTKKVTLEIKTHDDGLIKVRTLNGDILFQGYLVKGILSQLTLSVPKDVDQLLIEYKGQTENFSCGAKNIRFYF